MTIQTFIFYGQVGSGKGTQVELLQKYLKEKNSALDVLHTSTGAEFRKLIQSGNYVGQIVKDSLEKGSLQPDFLTISLFTDILVQNMKEETCLIADGFPRTITQSESFEAMMKLFNRENVKIIYIELSEEEATKRNLLRGRADDTEEGLRKRFNEYKNNVVPSMNYFKGKDGYEIFAINGEQSIEDVHRDIIKAINL
jgi:adenylate kinase family enzyme